MQLSFVILILHLVFCARTTFALACDKVVKVESTEVFNYLANVTFSVPVAVTGQWVLIMKTNVPYAFLGVWGMRVKTDPEKCMATIFNVEKVRIKKGEKFTFRFRISYEPYKPVPHVTQISWQGKPICSGKSETESEEMENSIYRPNNWKSGWIHNNTIRTY